jgi:hypothetical protein
MAVNRTAVLDEIRTLAAEQAPELAVVEETLTDGYAYALQLEMERLRLQRQLERQAGALGDSPSKGAVIELKTLAQGVEETDGELAELRAALELLKQTATRIRS